MAARHTTGGWIKRKSARHLTINLADHMGLPKGHVGRLPC